MCFLTRSFFLFFFWRIRHCDFVGIFEYNLISLYVALHKDCIVLRATRLFSAIS